MVNLAWHGYGSAWHGYQLCVRISFQVHPSQCYQVSGTLDHYFHAYFPYHHIQMLHMEMKQLLQTRQPIRGSQTFCYTGEGQSYCLLRPFRSIERIDKQNLHEIHVYCTVFTTGQVSYMRFYLHHSTLLGLATQKAKITFSYFSSNFPL